MGGNERSLSGVLQSFSRSVDGEYRTLCFLSRLWPYVSVLLDLVLQNFDAVREAVSTGCLKEVFKFTIESFQHCGVVSRTQRSKSSQLKMQSSQKFIPFEVSLCFEPSQPVGISPGLKRSLE